jgi:hypothetical protein
MPDPIVMQENFACKKDNLASCIPETDQVISIAQPVGLGPKAKNLPADVLTIQRALNRIPPDRGGPKTPLPETGKLTNQQSDPTIAAIQQFQIQQFGWSGADGRVDPGQQTIARINQILFSNQSVDPAAHAEIKVRMVQHLDLVARGVYAAQANLMSAMTPQGGMLQFVSDKANDRLNRHFRLDSLGAAARAKAIQDIQAVYTMFSNVLRMPGALGAGAFEMDPSGDPRVAFTFATGFFLQGQKDPKRNIPMDRIYLGRRSFFALSDKDFCAFIMLHEMGHFVGFPGGSLILDEGRGWFTDDTIKRLSAQQRLHNADSYAAFATECRTGSSAKPPYVKAATTSR